MSSVFSKKIKKFLTIFSIAAIGFIDYCVNAPVCVAYWVSGRTPNKCSYVNNKEKCERLNLSQKAARSDRPRAELKNAGNEGLETILIFPSKKYGSPGNMQKWQHPHQTLPLGIIRY